jgi:hypothetical protein
VPCAFKTPFKNRSNIKIKNSHKFDRSVRYFAPFGIRAYTLIVPSIASLSRHFVFLTFLSFKIIDSWASLKKGERSHARARMSGRRSLG